MIEELIKRSLFLTEARKSQISALVQKANQNEKDLLLKILQREESAYKALIEKKGAESFKIAVKKGNQSARKYTNNQKRNNLEITI